MTRNIYKATKEILNSLEQTEGKFLNLLKDLKQTTRSGKLVRIEKYLLKLPTQSIYSHLLLMANNGDFLKICLEKDLNKKQLLLVSRSIAFHDLSESIIGDVPMFTKKNLAGSLFKSAKQKAEEEKLANAIIANSLPPKIKKHFIKTIDFLENENSLARDFFIFLDKSEPIIAIWKYIHFYKDQIRIKRFLTAMEDFFNEKNVLPYCFNAETRKIANFLQNKNNAYQYYQKGSKIFESFRGERMTAGNMKKMIEQEKLHFVSKIN